jgi:branched-chain amino acid transport system permease protein
MTQVAEFLVIGVSRGAVYALLALGFVMVFKATGVVNFAHPGLLMAGAYVTARLGVSIQHSRIAALVVGLVVIAAFFVWFRFSTWGIAMRAVAEDPETAALMGIRRSRVAASAWLLAGALAAIAGLFLSVSPAAGLTTATAAAALHAFPAAIIGGLDSTSGAVVGGVIVGVAEALTQGFAGDLKFLGQNFDTVMPYVVMVLVLLVKPSGLFGTKELHRV